MAGWKNPRRGVYRRVRLHFAQSSSGHRSKCRMRFLLGPCGALCAQIWPLGGQNRARGTFASLRTDGEISEVPRNTPFFHQLLGRNKHFPAFPSMIRACYGRCESLTTFQCQVVENEAWPQTDRSLELPPVLLTYSRHLPSTRGPPPLSRTALPFLHPPLSRESPGLTK